MIIRRIKYRLFALLAVLLTLTFSGCREDDGTTAVGTGYLAFGEISVTADVDGETRAFSLPEVNSDDFTIAVVNADGDTITEALYKDLYGTTMSISAGTYSVKAYYGSNKAISDAPYYSGESTATVVANETTGASIASSLQSAVILPSIPTNQHVQNLKCVIACGNETDTIANDDVAYILINKEYNVSLVGTNAVGAPFSATVNDKLSFEKPTIYSLNCNVKLSLTLPSQSDGAWAKRFYFTPIQTTDADGKNVNIPYITYQLKLNGVWTDADSNLCVTGLTADTDYQVRAVMGDWTSDEQTVHTESEVQLPNNGLETWSSVVNTYYTVWYPRDDTDESTEGWCSINAKTSSSGANYGYCRNSGTEQTTDCYSGTYAAEIKTIGWGSGNTSAGSSSVINNISAGELFLGTMSSDYVADYYYHFSNRPSKVTFYAKYTPKSSREYSVTVGLYDENKELISSEEYSLSEGAISSYTKREIAIGYKYTTVKPTYIKLMFSSGDNSSSELDKPAFGWSLSSTGKNRSTGNKLYIDDINLVYE